MKNNSARLSRLFLPTFVTILSIVSISVTAWCQNAAPALKTTKLADNFYTIEGSGGTIGVLAGPDGLLVVDTGVPNLAEKVAAAIQQISTAPLRFVIDTHVHADHTGGNETLAKLGATILAREELRERLIHPAPDANGAPGKPAPAAALPVITYDAPVTIHLDGEEVDLIPVPKAHTDGDTMIRFRNADLIMAGDFYRSLGYPNFDRGSGGSLKGMVDGLNALINLAGPTTKVVPGHGQRVDKTAVAAYRDMLLVLRDRVAKQIQEGKTVDQVVAAHITSDYDAKVPGWDAKVGTGTTADRCVQQLYAELKGIAP